MKNLASLNSLSQDSIPLQSLLSWGQALTLTERLTLLRSSTCLSLDSHAQQKALQHLKRWKEQGRLKDSTLFADRLAFDSLNEQELLALLATPIADIWPTSISLPPWMQELEAALAQPDNSDPRAISSPMELFQPLFLPGIHKIVKHLQDLVLAGKNPHCEPATLLPGLLSNLATRVQNASSRALILELNIARLQNQLEGSTSEERQAFFWRKLSQPTHLRSFLEEYPVLARYLLTLIDGWTAYSLELVHHLSADWIQICEMFFQGKDPGPLADIMLGAGDVHNDGRSVAILRFKNGSRLVYKPRPLKLDLHFQNLLSWVNSQHICAPFQTIAVLNCETYGWCEFVEAHTCNSEDEVARFYERLGSYLALLYLLDASDFHYENLLAVGEQPILTDLESLFHARLAEETYDQVLHSVLRIGLLPSRDFKKNESHGTDFSGIGGGQAGKMSPMPVMVLKDAGTDQPYMSREYVEIPLTQNRPLLHGAEVNAQDYAQHLLSGFSQTYHLLLEKRDYLAREILPTFANDEVRIIVRPTSAYGAYLYGSLHTDCLQNALERDQILDRLWDMLPERPYLQHFLRAERRDLLRGDIPAFRTRPGSREIFTCQGEQLEATCVEPVLDFVYRRLAQLGEDDLARQQWVIQASLATMLMDSNEKRSVELREAAIPSQDQLLAEACKVGDRLAHLALWNDKTVNWLGIIMDADEQGNFFWSLQAADSRLYDGTSGIALFLAYLGSITSDNKYTELARSTLVTIRHSLQLEHYTRPGSMAPIGAFTGLGSYLYLFSHLASLWNDDQCLHDAESALTLIEDRLAQDEKMDIIAGSAGCILSLLSLYAVAPSDRVLTAALRCGDHLLTHAKEISGGLGWVMGPDYPALTGFSHGVSGIAYSLARLIEVSGEQRFLPAIEAGLKYERSLYSQEEKNWPHLAKNREGETIARMQSTWCHGAPGVGLGRLGMLNLIDDPQLSQEIQAALETTIREGFGHNQSLCHGDLGNLETLLVASQILPDERYQRLLPHISAAVFDGIKRCGWVTGVPLSVETPGLMVGLAGIGYQLLRLAEPKRIPSILLLYPPLKKVKHE